MENKLTLAKDTNLTKEQVSLSNRINRGESDAIGGLFIISLAGIGGYRAAQLMKVNPIIGATVGVGLLFGALLYAVRS